MDIKALYTHFLECNSVSTDTRKITSNTLFFALKGENFNGNAYAAQALEKGAKYAVIDEEAYHIPNKTILVENTLKALQQLATHHRQTLKTPIVALTGSNGKTTTKELINVVLSKVYNTTATLGNLNNHIGVPLTLLAMTKTTEIAIVEMGANHQKEIEQLCNIAQPDYGLITNFGKAHLEGFGGVEGVIKGKSELYDFLITNNKTIFVNTNDNIQVNKTKTANTYKFGDEATQPNVAIRFINATPFVTCIFNNTTIESKLIGDYNFNNIAVAIAIGQYFKVEDTQIKTAIENYIPSNNRSQIIQHKSSKIILDAYNANPTSMKAALLNLERQEGPKIAILGDMFELGELAVSEHQHIANLSASLNIDTILLTGEHFSETQIENTKTTQYRNFEALKAKLPELNIENATVLIKGSRGMALERVLDVI